VTEHVLLAGQQAQITPWLAAFIASTEYNHTATVVTDGPVDGQYYLPPGVVNRVETEINERSEPLLLVVDGTLHVGHLADLQGRFPDTEIHDRLSVVCKWLAVLNPVAADRLALRNARFDRRVAEQTQRDQQGSLPSGTSRRVTDLDGRCDRMHNRLADARKQARTRVETAYVDADGYVVLANAIGTDTHISKDCLLAASARTASLPLTAETDMIRMGVHDVAVTDLPAIPWEGRIPDWFEAVVPGAMAALRRADVVCSASPAVAERLSDRFDARSVSVPRGDTDAIRSAIADCFQTATVEASVPHTDAGYATVSWLYDHADVVDRTDGDRIELTVTASEENRPVIERRMQDVGGRIAPVSTEEKTTE